MYRSGKERSMSFEPGEGISSDGIGETNLCVGTTKLGADTCRSAGTLDSVDGLFGAGAHDRDCIA